MKDCRAKLVSGDDDTIRDLDAYVREINDGRIWLAPRYLDANAYGGAIGSARDAARLLRALLNEGALEDRSILEPETVRSMLKEHHVRAGPSTLAPAYLRQAGMEHGKGFGVFPAPEGERYEQPVPASASRRSSGSREGSRDRALGKRHVSRSRGDRRPTLRLVRGVASPTHIAGFIPIARRHAAI